MGDLSYHLDAKDKTLNDLYRSTGKVDRMERQLAALEPLLSSLQLSAQSQKQVTVDRAHADCLDSDSSNEFSYESELSIIQSLGLPHQAFILLCI